MKKNVYKALSAVFTACIASACVEDYNLSDLDTDDLELSTEISAPIGRSRVSIKDLLEKQDVKGLGYDSTGLVVFQYDTIQRFDLEAFKFSGFACEDKKTAWELMDDKLVKNGIADKDEFANLETPISLSLPKQDEIKFNTGFSMDEAMQNASNQRIDSIFFKTAPITISLGSNIKGLLDNCDVEMALVSGDKLIGRQRTQASKPLSLDISKNVVELGKDAEIVFQCVLIANKPTEIAVSKDSYLRVIFSAEEGSMKFGKVWGIFNDIEPYESSEVVDIDIYEQNEKEGTAYNLQLEDPKVELFVTSNIGVPFRLGINKLEASNDKTSKLASFRNGKSSFSSDLDYAKKVGEVVANFSETFDKNNGSIDNLLNLLPSKLGLDYKFEAMEGDLEAKENWFVTDDAFIDLGLKVYLPAYIRKGSFITVSDTIDDFEIGEDLDEKYSIDKLKLTAEITNSLPFDAEVSLIFLQEDTVNGVVVVSPVPNKNLVKTFKVESGQVGDDDRVTKETVAKQVLEFETDEIEDLKLARRVRIEYNVAVEDFDKVKVTRDNALKVELKAYAKGNVYINKF